MFRGLGQPRRVILAVSNDNPRLPRPTRSTRRYVLFFLGVVASWTVILFLSPPAISETGQPSGMLKAIFCLLLVTFGVSCAFLYFRTPPITVADSKFARFYDRPWRRVGAAICLLVSVMFVLGVYLVDIPEHPRTYATYWLLIMVLVLWACGLAVKDVWYTHRMMKSRRSERLSSAPLNSSADVISRDTKP